MRTIPSTLYDKSIVFMFSVIAASGRNLDDNIDTAKVTITFAPALSSNRLILPRIIKTKENMTKNKSARSNKNSLEPPKNATKKGPKICCIKSIILVETAPKSQAAETNKGIVINAKIIKQMKPTFFIIN